VIPTYDALTTHKLLADKCLLLDRELKRIKERTDRIGQNRQNAAHRPAGINQATKPIEARTPQAITGPQAATPFTNRPRPVYDNPQHQALSRAGACFKCYEVGHRARECPQNMKAIEYQAENQGNESP
jgi:Zinc knuckle